MADIRKELRRELKRAGKQSRSNGRGNGRVSRRLMSLPAPPAPPGSGQPRRRPRLKKLRILLILAGLALLAIVSTVFGMMMAVAQDLPSIQNYPQFRAAKNSLVTDVRGRTIGTLTSNENRILVNSGDISQNVKQAVVSIEDNRFYEHHGVDFKGVGRALLQDVISRTAAQGGSTITEQFVKNALEAQGDRTVFEKLREAALAYHLERRWSKDKILTAYLNTVYFGNGAYGVEAAARTYFGKAHPGCGQGEAPKCASLLTPDQAALLAGVISSPAQYDPKAHPQAALERRNVVLGKMNEQGYLPDVDYADATKQSPPAPSQIEPPAEDSKAPYFTSWLRQQVVDLYGPGRAFFGGLKIRSTLDLDLQAATEQAISSHLSGIAPTGAAVVIDNKTGGVRALVGGFDFRHKPFNLATNGHRQPGSAFKPFTLLTALQNGVSPNQTYTSQVKTFTVPHSGGKEKFTVHNYDDLYAGVSTLAHATTVSDNSVYAEVGLDVGTKKIARTASSMGIETPVSTNPAMVLGGLKEGVTPLEMAHAYSTLAHDGERVSGTLVPPHDPGGPVAIQEVTDKSDHPVRDRFGFSGDNKIITKRVIPKSVVNTAIPILETVVSEGTGTRAATGDSPEWGKTGTTENNGDAWFVGSTSQITVAVWVGHADSTQSMAYDFGGAPVDGGTYPALIWHDIVTAYDSIQAQRGAARDARTATTTTTSSGSLPSAPAPTTAAPAPAPPSNAPQPVPTPAPSNPAPAGPPAPPPPSGGGGGGTGGAGGAPGGTG